MAPDLPTLAALVGVGGVLAGVIIQLFRTRLRLKELEAWAKQAQEFVPAFREMVAASQAGVRIQQAQFVVVQNALLARQTVDVRALRLQEHQAGYARIMNWLEFGLKAYDTYRMRHPSDEQDE